MTPLTKVHYSTSIEHLLNLFWKFNYSTSSRITFQVYHQIHTDFRENRIRDKNPRLVMLLAILLNALKLFDPGTLYSQHNSLNINGLDTINQKLLL